MAGTTTTRSKTQLARLSATTATTSGYQTHAKLEIYLKSYWQHFHSFFPIVHRPTFELTQDNQLLTFALAAIGSQYHKPAGARTTGYKLNDYCRKAIDRCTTWNLQTMQAILLTEFFTLFRGRKTSVRVSSEFEALYRRLLENENQDYTHSFSGISGSGTSANALLDQLETQANDQTRENQGLQQEWLQWIDNEARRRLHIGCFIVDVHQALYHQQPRSCADPGPSSIPCWRILWDASSASEWQMQQSRSDSGSQPIEDVKQSAAVQDTRTEVYLSRSLLISSLATRLPAREDSAYSNDTQRNHPGVANLMDLFPSNPVAQAYLALSHTPLHDLLAIAGDTWIFGKKITPPSAFHDASIRLKAWSCSPAAAQATLHACRVLRLKISSQINHTNCLTDYWNEYVSVLICWAFGHRFQAAAGGSGTISRNSSSGELNAMDSDNASNEANRKALTYLDGILALDVNDLLSSSNSSKALKGDTSGIIAVVRQRLEAESVGATCGMLVDCIGVLCKISKVGKGKWF